MADMWAVVTLLAGYIGVCYGAVCSRVTRNSYFFQTTTYMYCSYGCCGSSYNRYCCTSSGTIAGIVIAVLAGVCVLAFLFCLCVKKQKRPGRVVVPHSNIHHSNVTFLYAGSSGQYSSGFRNSPPVPPPYKAHDPPPPYAFNPGPGGRQTNKPHYNSPTVPQPSWQAPPPGNPPRNDNPPMPQPEPPSRDITSPAPPYSPPGVPLSNDNTIHPPPGPLPPPTAPLNHTT